MFNFQSFIGGFHKSIVLKLDIFSLSDSSADPLLDEHFRRSLGADYESLFAKNKNKSDSESSSVESTPPKVPESPKSSISRDSDSTKVDDPVKAFQEDMEMEGYTGKNLIVVHLTKAQAKT